MRLTAIPFFLFALLTISKSTTDIETQKNVLLIIADDLRPSLACYGDNLVKTPHLDGLASRSMLFSTVAAQLALCAPSRTSFLTSRRPDTTEIFTNKGIFYWRDKGNYTTLPQYFKHAGYITASVGKVFHSGEASNKTHDYPYSWSLPPYIPSTLKYSNTKVCPNDDGSLHTNIFCPVDVAKQPEGSLPDIQNTRFALGLLRNFSSQPETSRKPFFLAVGLYKPHIPLRFPKEFLDLYPLHNVPIAPDPFLPLNLPPVAYEPWTDLRWRDDIAALNLSFPYGPMPSLYAKKIRQGYYASTSYIDSLIGDLLKGVDRYGFRENTVIAVIGDHGK
ncbi:hypothetical protein QZH41_013051 [Actinostola sp. cb2023]|nr:hypothetical protein QZH41_013051 [Actinostola sp. cb2023]